LKHFGPLPVQIGIWNQILLALNMDMFMYVINKFVSQSLKFRSPIGAWIVTRPANDAACLSH